MPFLMSIMLWPVQIMPQQPGMAMPPMPFDFQSEDELLKWAQQVSQDVEQFRQSLSPEDRAKFDKEVEDLAQEMSKMNENELTSFIDNVFQMEAQGLDNYPDVTPVAPQEPASAVEEPVKKPEIPAKGVEAVKALATDISHHIESFLRKAQLIPDLYGSLNAWLPAGMLSLKPGLTWDQLKKDIEQLNISIKSLLNHDPATGNYYYLASVVTNEKLYNNLSNFSTALKRDEPLVEPPAFGLGTITKDSRKATSATLSTCADAAYILDIAGSIKSLVTAFEPEAKKLRDLEEGSRKKAIEDSKKTLTQAPMRTGGSTHFDSSYDRSASDSYRGYQDAAGSYAPYTAPYHPSSQESSSYDVRPKAEGKQSTKAPASAPQSKEAAKKKDEEEKKETKIDPNSPAEKTVGHIEMYLDNAIRLIQRKKLDQSINDPSKKEAVNDAANEINSIIKRIKRLERETKDFVPEARKRYITRIKDAIKEDKETFDAIITMGDKDNELRKALEELYDKLNLTAQVRKVKQVVAQPVEAPAATKQTTPSSSSTTSTVS